MAAEELEEELDDPISIMGFKDIKTGIKHVTDQIPSAVIDLEDSTDDESTYTSSYGKRDFVLPVTFFDIPRNVKLLSKCKPMSIKVVDCKQHPAYYRKSIRKKVVNEPDDFVEENKEKPSDCANKSNNPGDIAINASEITDKVAYKQHNDRKRGDAFYEKLKRRKERKKEIALSSIDLSQIDFKRNKGLIGLKITGDIFKQIVETEKALVKTKCNSGETHAQEKSGCQTTKTNTDEDKSGKMTKSAVENPLSKTKSKSDENRTKEKNQRDKESNRTKSNSAEYKTKEKSESHSDNVLVKTKTYFVEDKEKSETDTGSVLVRMKSNAAKNKAQENSETETDSVLARTKSILAEGKAQKNCECKFVKEVGDVLSSLGTSVIPIANTNIHVPKNITLNGDKEATSTNAHAELSHVKDKQESIENTKKRFSLHIPTDKIIGKALKHKKTTCDARTSKIITPSKTVKQKPKELTSKDDKKVPKLNLKRSSNDADNFYVTSETNKIRREIAKNTAVGKSREVKQDDEANINKDTTITKNQEGSNSPVIPCTTLNVSRASIPPNVAANDSSTSNQISNKTLTIVECKISKKNPLFTCLIESKSNGLAENTADVTKNRLSDKGVSNTNTAKCTTELKTQIKPPSAENTSLSTDQMIHSLDKSQPNPNLSNDTPAFIRPRYYGNNAIILRKTPHLLQLKTNRFPNQEGHIQTVITNRPQHQSMLTASSGMLAARCQVAPCYPPPNCNNVNYAQLRPMDHNNFPHFRMPFASTIRGTGPGINNCGPQNLYPTRYRFPPPPPPPPGPPPHGNSNPQKNPGPPTPTMDVSNDSIIGSTTTGEPIKKINIIARPANTVNNKEMMLAELNNAMMSPELTLNNLRDKSSDQIDRNVDPRSSKPVPLSKKDNNVDLNPVKITGKSPPKIGYSPPILPILTYRESFEIFSQNGKYMQKPVATGNACNHTFPLNTKYAGLNIRKLDKMVQKRKILHGESGQDNAKKISFEDYKKRVSKHDMIDVYQIRKYNESKNPADDYNQDQGYDSDSTVKL